MYCKMLGTAGGGAIPKKKCMEKLGRAWKYVRVIFRILLNSCGSYSTVRILILEFSYIPQSAPIVCIYLYSCILYRRMRAANAYNRSTSTVLYSYLYKYYVYTYIRVDAVSVQYEYM